MIQTHGLFYSKGTEGMAQPGQPYLVSWLKHCQSVQNFPAGNLDFYTEAPNSFRVDFQTDTVHHGSDISGMSRKEALGPPQNSPAAHAGCPAQPSSPS